MRMIHFIKLLLLYPAHEKVISLLYNRSSMYFAIELLMESPNSHTFLLTYRDFLINGVNFSCLTTWIWVSPIFSHRNMEVTVSIHNVSPWPHIFSHCVKVSPFFNRNSFWCEMLEINSYQVNSCHEARNKV